VVGAPPAACEKTQTLLIAMMLTSDHFQVFEE